MILNFQTDMPGQIVQTQIRLLLGAVWSGSTLFAISGCIFWVHYSSVKPSCSNFRVITANFLGVRIFRIFTVTELEGMFHTSKKQNYKVDTYSNWLLPKLLSFFFPKVSHISLIFKLYPCILKNPYKVSYRESQHISAKVLFLLGVTSYLKINNNYCICTVFTHRSQNIKEQTM